MGGINIQWPLPTLDPKQPSKNARKLPPQDKCRATHSNGDDIEIVWLTAVHLAQLVAARARTLTVI